MASQGAGAADPSDESAPKLKTSRSTESLASPSLSSSSHVSDSLSASPSKGHVEASGIDRNSIDKKASPSKEHVEASDRNSIDNKDSPSKEHVDASRIDRNSVDNKDSPSKGHVEASGINRISMDNKDSVKENGVPEAEGASQDSIERFGVPAVQSPRAHLRDPDRSRAGVRSMSVDGLSGRAGVLRTLSESSADSGSSREGSPSKRLPDKTPPSVIVTGSPGPKSLPASPVSPSSPVSPIPTGGGRQRATSFKKKRPSKAPPTPPGRDTPTHQRHRSAPEYRSLEDPVAIHVEDADQKLNADDAAVEDIKRRESRKVLERPRQSIMMSIEEARRYQLQLQLELKLKKEGAAALDPSQQKVIHLPRGGFYVNTLAGAVQFGLPPETIKDSMNLGLTLPQHFVIPKERFNLQIGVNQAEFEFPAYYMFFFKRKKINLICSPEVEPLIRTIFRETLLGPQEITAPDRYSKEVPKEAYPDLDAELRSFRVNPFNRSEELTVDSLLQFTHFIEGVAKLDNGVEIKDIGPEYVISQEGKEYARVSCHVFLSPPFLDLKDDMPHFVPPYFGVTMLGNSDGFDSKGTTTGFVVWMNRRGIMVDPPPHSGRLLRKHGINPRLIHGVILSHCHADHDAGTFQKILEEGRVVLMTTEVIGNSFLRKYCAISGLEPATLRKLFHFRPVIVGERVNVYGGYLRFFYSLHSIPCVGFTAYSNGKSLVYSGDSFNDTEGIQKLHQQGFMTEQRRDKLLNFPWHHDLILHEAGVPPIHTPLKTFEALSEDILRRLYIVHKPARDVPKEKGLKSALVGPENTIVISNETGPHFEELEALDLVGTIEVFSNLVVSRGVEVISSARRIFFEKGETLIQEGTFGEVMYIVAMGVVAVTVAGKFIKHLTVGDHFGEMSIISKCKRTASIIAHTRVECITFHSEDFFYILRGTDALERLGQLGVMQRTASWQCLMQNSVFKELTSSQKTYLQSLLRRREVKQGEEIWNVGDKNRIGILIEEGEFVFAGARDLKPFTRGAFVGDMKALLNNQPLTTALICISAKASFYYVDGVELLKFIEDNPGLFVFFMNRRFVE